MQNVHEFLKIKFETSKMFHAWLHRSKLCPQTPGGACLPSSLAVWPTLVGKLEKHGTREYLLFFLVASNVLRSTHVAKWWSTWWGCRLHHEFFRVMTILFIFGSSILHPTPTMFVLPVSSSNRLLCFLCQAHTRLSPQITGDLFLVRHRISRSMGDSGI